MGAARHLLHQCENMAPQRFDDFYLYSAIPWKTPRPSRSEPHLVDPKIVVNE